MLLLRISSEFRSISSTALANKSGRMSLTSTPRAYSVSAASSRTKVTAEQDHSGEKTQSGLVVDDPDTPQTSMSSSRQASSNRVQPPIRWFRVTIE